MFFVLKSKLAEELRGGITIPNLYRQVIRSNENGLVVRGSEDWVW